MNRILELVFFKTYADLKAEVSRNYLGFLWWVIEPILYMGAFFFIFGLGFRKGSTEFIYFLLAGITAWKWFASSLTASSYVLKSNKGTMNQVAVPKIVFPIIMILDNMIKYLFVLALFIIALVIGGYYPNVAWLSLPIVLLVQLTFICATSGLVAAIVPFVPDLSLLINNFMMILFFMSGIFFDINSLESEAVKTIMNFNPMVGIIESYRGIFLRSDWPDFSTMAAIASISLIGILIAIMLFSRFDKLYAKVS